MIYNHRYISLGVLKLLIEKKCPLCIPIHRRSIIENTPIYYTKQPDEDGWETCDCYHYPTQDQVIDWLEEEHKIFISSFPLYDFNKINHPLMNKYGVDIKDEKGIEHGRNHNYYSKEMAINTALMYVIDNLI